MQSVESVSAERAEVEAILQSGAFSRAPNLTKILRYSCERYFEGQGDQIKEYNVAVEALGRPPDFDQKKDSIVRVEARKLRRRLKEFYESEGASHHIRIEIPNGQYAPIFIYNGVQNASREEAPALPVENAEPLSVVDVLPSTAAPESATGARSRFRSWVAPAAFIAACAIALSVGLHYTRSASTVATDEVWRGPATEVPSEFRMLAGYHGPAYKDRQGRIWEPDAYYNGGRSKPITRGLSFEFVPDPFFVHAIREGDFRYDVPVRAGTYELHLYFIEPPGPKTARTEAAEEEGRSFQVEVNGKILISGLDLLSEAGAPNRLYERVFRDISRGKDGKIHLGFHPISGSAVLTAMEVLADAPGKVRPIRIVARKSSLIDISGTVWWADEYVLGGRLVERRDSVGETPDKTLYESERFGNFGYYIPAAPGRYQLTLYFAETYFGTRLPLEFRDFGNGARIFNVCVNGEAVLRDFEILKAAGGPNRGIRRTFDNVQPNAQGKIVIEFNAIRNYAEVNAIELVGMDDSAGPTGVNAK